MQKADILAPDPPQEVLNSFPKQTNLRYFRLDTDGDGQLTIDEFKVLFAHAYKRKKEPKKNPLAKGQQSAKLTSSIK